MLPFSCDLNYSALGFNVQGSHIIEHQRRVLNLFEMFESKNDFLRLGRKAKSLRQWTNPYLSQI